MVVFPLIRTTTFCTAEVQCCAAQCPPPLHLYTPSPDTGVCKWTGCDARCEDMSDFNKHITGQLKI